MTIRLTVQRERWWNHVTDVATTTPGLIPVVKGNGYGFSRAGLAELALKFSEVLAVGTVHELADLPDRATPLVLTPTLQAPESTTPILTVGAPEHIAALRGWGGRVIVKLESTMNRYGGGIEVVAAAQQAGLSTVGVAIHPPLAGTDDDHRAEIERWLPHIDPSLDVWVSHLSPTTYEQLPASHRFRLRSGSYLWHGDRGALHLEADVLQTRPVRAGTAAGYRQHIVGADSTLVMVGAGTAGGVAALADGRSPFHFARTRLELLETPHMHTSMVLATGDTPVPEVGDWVDLQRPLLQTDVDELRWI